MCAGRTKKENEPDSLKSGMREFAWQYFEVVDEKTAIEAVAIFLFPDGVSPGGYPDKNATERVRIAVSRARKKKLILPRVSNTPNTLFVKNFISWACTHWPSLQTVIPTHGATFQLFTPDPMLGSVSPSEAFELKLPKEYEALATEYRKLYEAWRDETRQRISVERELETYKRADEKRREDGAKRYD